MACSSTTHAARPSTTWTRNHRAGQSEIKSAVWIKPDRQRHSEISGGKQSMANLKELLQEMVPGSEEHRWKGITPQSVALIFVRHPEKVGRSHLGEQALVSNSY